MKQIIIAWLFMKALFWPYFDIYDVMAANAVRGEKIGFIQIIAGVPDLQVVYETEKVYLPEARAEIVWSVRSWLQ